MDDRIREAKHQTAMSILRLLSKMAGEESEKGNKEAMYALNRAWHAVNDKRNEPFDKQLNGELEAK